VTATCAWCSAPRVSGDTCPHCGANYEKAEAIRSQGRAAAVVLPETTVEDPVDTEEAPDEWRQVADPALERKFCIAAIPVALVLGALFKASDLGAFLQRTFMGMPLHELGHAVAAWFCGFFAIPTLWFTPVAETRGLLTPLALSGAIGYMIWRAHRAGRASLVYVGCALLLLQGIGTLGINPDTARAVYIFCGDGGGMILATLLMASFYFGKSTQLYKGSVRWGLVVIGAGAFNDIFGTWWRARGDDQAIPYGTSAGRPSDSMWLIDDHGWTAQSLTSGYLTLGVFCLLALAAVYAWGLWRAGKEIEARRVRRERADREKRRREMGSGR
jgi:hypothetical protein